jgi:hypothetical protein
MTTRSVSALTWLWIAAVFAGYVWTMRAYAKPVYELFLGLLR